MWVNRFGAWMNVVGEQLMIFLFNGLALTVVRNFTRERTSELKV